MRRKWFLLVALIVGLVAAVVAAPGLQLAGPAVERLTNGDFESGFEMTAAGEVGQGWHWFDNGGRARYGFYDETWAPVVYDGQHSQLIEINTYGQDASDVDRYAGIYQTVAVVAGESYDLALHGMLRALADDPDLSGYNYRVQYGVDYDGGTDWTVVDNWVELPWDTVYPRLDPGAMQSYSTTLKATSPRLTLFVRAWKKWGTTGRELDVNLDAISLKGAMPAGSGAAPTVSLVAPGYPAAGQEQEVKVKASNDVGIVEVVLTDDGQTVGSLSYDVGILQLEHSFAWTPESAGSHTLKVTVTDTDGKTATDQATVTVGGLAEFLVNGGFEGGFVAVPRGHVGLGWGSFDNDGEARYGFYDETWTPVIYDGEHAQLIEINTYGLNRSDPNRYAGIYQVVSGLTPGATYELSLHGMLRALADDPDLSGYNYLVQWGYDPAGGSDWTVVDNWVDLPWNKVYARLDPGEMDSYSVEFQAPSATITLYFRAWKKWGTVGRELDVNLDAISLQGYK